jgi:hypothetical protein
MVNLRSANEGIFALIRDLYYLTWFSMWATDDNNNSYVVAYDLSRIDMSAIRWEKKQEFIGKLPLWFIAQITIKVAPDSAEMGWNTILFEGMEFYRLCLESSLFDDKSKQTVPTELVKTYLNQLVLYDPKKIDPSLPIKDRYCCPLAQIPNKVMYLLDDLTSQEINKSDLLTVEIRKILTEYESKVANTASFMGGDGETTTFVQFIKHLDNILALALHQQITQIDKDISILGRKMQKLPDFTSYIHAIGQEKATWTPEH